MYSAKIEEGNCRICLEANAEQDWNDCLNDYDFVTYKDCYYKYTNLDAFDEENIDLPTIICRNCSDNLKNINIFVSKAIEIHNLLHESVLSPSKGGDVFEANFETILLSETDIKTNLQNHFMNNDSSYDSDVRFAEHTNTSIKQRKEYEVESIESTSSGLQNDQKKYKIANPSKIPTCCTICSKVLSSKYNAIEHEKIHLKNRERNEICKECGMKFYDKNALRCHMRVHIKNREKSKRCDYCDKAFYDSGALNIHRRIHLGQMVKCNLCTKEFYREVDLDRHMLSHSTTKIDREAKPQKKYFVCCEFCGDNVRSVYYKSHIAKHNNEPLAKCAICNKEFFARKSCVKHLKVVHRKGSGEISNCIIAYGTNRFSNLFLQQNAAKIFIKEENMT